MECICIIFQSFLLLFRRNPVEFQLDFCPILQIFILQDNGRNQANSQYNLLLLIMHLGVGMNLAICWFNVPVLPKMNRRYPRPQVFAATTQSSAFRSAGYQPIYNRWQCQVCLNT